MKCHEGFDKAEALSIGVCSDCSIEFCEQHPNHNKWRVSVGLQPKVQVFKPDTGEKVPFKVVSTPNPTPSLVFRPQPRRAGGYTQGRMQTDHTTSAIIGKALRKMVEAAQIIIKEEDLGSLRAVSKRGVWATHYSPAKNHVQFGEGSALLHYEGRSRDTVMKEMIRYGWERTPETGWLMIVIHEVAHAVNRKVNGQPMFGYSRRRRVRPHGPEFQACLRALRAKYFNRLISMFKGIRPIESLAANKEG